MEFLKKINNHYFREKINGKTFNQKIDIYGLKNFCH